MTSTVLNRHNGRSTEEIIRGGWGLSDRYCLLAIGHNEDVDVWFETPLYSDETAALLADPTLDVGLAGREVLVSLFVDGLELWKGYYTCSPWPEDPDPVRDLVGALVMSIDGYDRHGTAARDRALYTLKNWLDY